ncbi:MAG: hypothetical protein F6K03_08930 [Kamptonema sp. SIO4C4]|nr:hypothetical protein [Kamptonema sp. SIO4C4]
MNRFLYEHSLSTLGYLIVPVLAQTIADRPIYSYGLLSDQGRHGQFHQQQNPAGLHSESIIGIIDIAKHHLTSIMSHPPKTDYFQNRYTYRNNLIIVHQQGNKCYYDHYPPHELRNIAAPKIFASSEECIAWVKGGL